MNFYWASVKNLRVPRVGFSGLYEFNNYKSKK